MKQLLQSNARSKQSGGRLPMNDALHTYLHDHLACARAAIELLHQMRDRADDHLLREFAGDLLVQVEADRSTLQGLTEKLGAGSSVLKEAAGWFGERATRLKFRQSTGDEFAKFQALEFLALGVLGKMGMWKALEVITVSDERLRAYDFNHLAAGAQAQHARLQQERLRSAGAALSAKE